MEAKECWLARPSDHSAGSVGRRGEVSRVEEAWSSCDAQFASLRALLSLCSHHACAESLHDAGLLCTSAWHAQPVNKAPCRRRAPVPYLDPPRCQGSAVQIRVRHVIPSTLLAFWFGEPMHRDDLLEWEAIQARAGMYVKLVTPSNLGNFTPASAPVHVALRSLLGRESECTPTRAIRRQVDEREPRHARCCSRASQQNSSVSSWGELRGPRFSLIYPLRDAFIPNRKTNRQHLSVQAQLRMLTSLLSSQKRNSTGRG